MNDLFDQLTAPPRADTDLAEQEEARMPDADPVPSEQPLEERDETPGIIRQCAQELLKHGLVEQAHKPKSYAAALLHRDRLRAVLEPLDLDLKLDEIRGLAFLTVARNAQEEAEDDEWSHPLVRRQRLTLEQSLLAAILRRCFLAHEQEAGIGAAGAVAFVDELMPELQVFLPELGSDRQEQTRIRNLLEKLKGHGLVSDINDHDQVTIRPLIAHLANPENLQALLHQYRSLAAKPDD